jgi:hypothetical protein
MRSVFLTLALAASMTASWSQTVNLTSSNLPIIVIQTNGQEIPDDPKITADMGIINNGPGLRNNINDPFNEYTGKIGIEIRGQSSQMFPMKSYSLELRDAAGKSVDRSLFGFPKESDWVLYAPYTDKTLMRNVLAYQLSRDLGQWAARTKFVEVVINGDYRGVYVFMERIKRNTGRVNIPKMAKTDVSGDALTGGYIFSLDKEPNGWFSKFVAPNSTSQNKRRFSYVYPKPEDIVPEQQAYIERYVDSFEAALASPQYQDPVNGVRKFASLSSFVDYFIVNEVSRNVDGYRLSTYMYKNRNSTDRRIVMGPVWDYDLAFRNANYCSGSDTRGWAYQFNTVCPGDGAGLIPFWWNRLMTDTAFTGSLRCRWKARRQNTLSLTRLNAFIDSVAREVDEAQQRHFRRWPILGQYVWPNPEPIPTSYAGELSALKNWLRDRLGWIDENLPDAGACADFADIEGTLRFSIYPNPMVSSAEVMVRSRFDQGMTLRVLDMTGREVLNEKQFIYRGNNRIPLNAPWWPAGIYMLEIRNTSGEGGRLRLVKVEP